MQKWKRISDKVYELVPDGGSRFVLRVRSDALGSWRAFVSENDVDEGAIYPSFETAQRAAMDAYCNYWADFEDPIHE